MFSITGINVVWSALGVTFPVLVLERYGDRPQVLGWIFGGFGVGQVVGARALVPDHRPCRPAPARDDGGRRPDGGALAPAARTCPGRCSRRRRRSTGAFFPFLNSVVITTRTMRTPPHLRPTVHTAAVTVALMLAPLGALAAGPALSAFGLDPVLAVVLAANTLFGVMFAWAGLRERAASTAEEPRLVVDREDEPTRAGVAAGVGRRRD